MVKATLYLFPSRHIKSCKSPLLMAIEALHILNVMVLSTLRPTPVLPEPPPLNDSATRVSAMGTSDPLTPPFGEDGEPEFEIDVVVRPRTRTRKPSMFTVLMLNDDYTPMEFVVHVLERFFGKSRDEATDIMLEVHQHGVGVCGVFTYEVAESKVAHVMDLARKNQHPLQCTLEKE